MPAKLKGKFGYGDVWTWAAIDADTKVIPSFVIGNRSAATARWIIEDLKGGLRNRIQLTTGGRKLYPQEVPHATAGLETRFYWVFSSAPGVQADPLSEMNKSLSWRDYAK